MPEAGSATDINFTVKKADIYKISFIYAQDPQRQKEEEKLIEEAFPGYGSVRLQSGFARSLRLLSWPDTTVIRRKASLSQLARVKRKSGLYGQKNLAKSNTQIHTKP